MFSAEKAYGLYLLICDMKRSLFISEREIGNGFREYSIKIFTVMIFVFNGI